MVTAASENCLRELVPDAEKGGVFLNFDGNYVAEDEEAEVNLPKEHAHNHLSQAQKDDVMIFITSSIKTPSGGRPEAALTDRFSGTGC